MIEALTCKRELFGDLEFGEYRSSLRIQRNVLDAFPMPGVGDVHSSVACLDHGRIGVLSGLVFQCKKRRPLKTVDGIGYIER